MQATTEKVCFIFCFVFAAIVAKFFFFKEWKIDFLCPKESVERERSKEGNRSKVQE